MKSAVDLFRDHDRGLVASRFSRFDPASEGLSEIWHGGSLLGALVVRQAKARSEWRDFLGQPRAAIYPGQSIVRRFACIEGAEAIIGEEIKALGPESLFEGWVESARDQAVARYLGASWRGTKVSAYGEMRGLWSSAGGDPIDYGINGLGLQRFPLDWDLEQIRVELEKELPEFADHYSPYNKRHSWSACSLRGYSDDPLFIAKPSEMSKAWKEENPEALGWKLRDTPLMDSFPSILDLIEALEAEGGQAHRIRFMRLQPGGGELSRHADITDPDAGGSEDGKLMRLHLPIRSNPGVRFQSWRPNGEKIEAHMSEGSAWWLDSRLPHTARNSGDSARIHLVIDMESSPALRDRIWPSIP